MCRTTRDYYSYPTAKAKGERNLPVSVITAERGIFARCKSSEMAFITGEACRLWLRSEDNDSAGLTLLSNSLFTPLPPEPALPPATSRHQPTPPSLLKKRPFSQTMRKLAEGGFDHPVMRRCVTGLRHRYLVSHSKIPNSGD